MMLDPTTLLIANAANLVFMAATFAFIMGKDLGQAARDARRGLVLQAAAWVLLIGSRSFGGLASEWVLSALSIGCFSATQWFMFRALAGWLGPRPWHRQMDVLTVAAPVIYAAAFSSYPLRVGAVNLLFSVQMLILARAALYPVTPMRGRWRWVLAGAVVTMAGFTALRGILGGFFTELYPYFRAPTPINVAAILATNLTLVIASVTVLVAWHEEAEQQLRARAITDALTGVLNRRGWEEMARPLLAQARRYRQHIALLVLDLDHFKAINDSRGHDAGDAALRVFGRLLSQGQRSGDVIARIGGEEFCVLLPHAGYNAARGFDLRLRMALDEVAEAELGFPLDFSSGYAALRADDDLDTLLARADAALYRAKQAGRGRMLAEPRVGSAALAAGRRA